LAASSGAFNDDSNILNLNILRDTLD
jgi:hypothetical protein